jgi:hypothetical protein
MHGHRDATTVPCARSHERRYRCKSLARSELPFTHGARQRLLSASDGGRRTVFAMTTARSRRLMRPRRIDRPGRLRRQRKANHAIRFKRPRRAWRLAGCGVDPTSDRAVCVPVAARASRVDDRGPSALPHAARQPVEDGAAPCRRRSGPTARQRPKSPTARFA